MAEDAATSKKAKDDSSSAEVPRPDRAAVMVSKYAAASAVAGLIPMPLADIAAISAVQMKMVHGLSKLYDVPFSSQSAKSAVASLTGAVAADSIGRVGLGSMIKMIPVVGHVASMLALPGVACIATSTMGQIFIQHFETGGTLLDLNLKVWRPIYQEKVQSAAKAA
ncbi:MAG TPA: GTPase [Dehalococcoidia bacterium]|jgi:uncharacterized protein (DUF697 family)|nr:DUF697 domain-containing protein [SAR202 cluster bacterium]HAL46797.1 GTPase [Dehalococcoidia bacterium]